MWFRAGRRRAAGEVRKTVTVLFTDVTGSTSLGERLDPEALRRVMGRYFDRVQAVVERHGGTVEKFIGDAVMAVFGIPVLHEDDALRALRAAAEIGAELRTLNKELERDFGVTIATRTGVNTGEVVTGDASSGQRLATGDTVNTAARLEQAAAPDEVLIGEPTWRLARAAIVALPVEPLELKGKALPVAAFRLEEVLPDVEAFERHLDSPMVGRDDELQLLEGAFRRSARERTTLLFTVLGAAGVGKSRLAQEFVRSVGAGGRVLRGRCLAYGEGITYWPLVDIVKDGARVTDNDPPDEAVARIRALLPADEPDGDVIASRVAGAAGILEEPGSADEIAWAARRLFEQLAREQPLVVVFDDIHWAEPTLLDLIEHVADWSRDAPILLLCMARHELLELRSGWGGGKLNATTIQLEPLTAGESAELVENLLASELDESVRARVTEAAEGNPLFVEQMVSMLIDDGFLERRDDRWVVVGDMSAVTVPPSINALVTARLDRLGPDERGVVDRASIEGKFFHVGGVVALTDGGDATEVRRHLMTLTRRELVRPDRTELRGEEGFRFRHQVIRDATYDSLPKATRAALHERFADWLRGRERDDRGEFLEIVGYHLEQAVRYRRELGQGPDAWSAVAERARAALQRAGRQAFDRGDIAASVKLCDRARELALPGSPAFVDASLDLAEAADWAGEFEVAERTSQDAVATAEALGDRVLLARANVALLHSSQTRDPEGTKDRVPMVLDWALPVLEEAGDHRAIAFAWLLRVEMWNEVADRTRMSEGIEQAIEHIRMTNDRAFLIRLLGLRWSNGYWGTVPAEEGIRRWDEVREELADAPLSLARASLYTAGYLGMLERFDDARALAEQSRRTMLEIGGPYIAATAGFVIGPLEMWAGDPAAAEAELRSNCEQLGERGERAWFCSLACLLAEALYQQGKDDEAVEWLERSREAAPLNDLEAVSDRRCIEGKILARRGRFDEAIAAVRDGLSVGQRTDEIDHAADAWADVSEVLRMAGRDEEARDAALEAIAIYERKGNIAAASNVRRALDGA